VVVGQTTPISMQQTQLLVHEIGPICNLAAAHSAKCPSANPERFLNTERVLDDETILDNVRQAYEMGFQGAHAFHYYNEPSLESERLTRLIAKIREICASAKFLLWTNGTNTDIWKEFNCIKLSNYEGRTDWPAHPNIDIIRPRFDNRILPGRRTRRPCFRPYVELVIDAFGNHHLCCADYMGIVTRLNVFKDGFPAIVKTHLEYRRIVSEEFVAAAPEICRRCQIKLNEIVTLII